MKNLFIARLSLLLYGCTTFPQAVKPTTGGQPYPTEIYIVSHGWHTGIIAPAHDVNTVLPQLKNGSLRRRSGMKSAGAIRAFISHKK